MSAIVTGFVARLPNRVNTLTDLLRQSNLDDLRRAVHQLKGAGGGYGFPDISTRAARAEATLRADTPDLAAIQSQLDDLISLLRSIEGYDPSRETPAGATQPQA